MALKVGDVVRARVSGYELSIKKKLGEGTQGVAYLVEGPDGQEVVKWYFRSQGTLRAARGDREPCEPGQTAWQRWRALCLAEGHRHFLD
jgi:hypothetical protein